MTTSLGKHPALADGVGLAPVLALDIGGTKLAAGVVDATGKVHSFLAEASREA